MSTKLEQDTFAGKTMQAWKDQATKAGLVLRAPSDKTDSGDYPDKIYSTLRRFRRNIAITKDHKKIITNISRQLVTQRDDKGKTTKNILLIQVTTAVQLTKERNMMQILRLENIKGPR